ncbi:glutamate--tRNA ligase [Croceicoccus naphthovorans]|uniref:Glutamate--tRNA ligase n=1 Tax=Croceicoccus naphthovorans TaxID=1348774 RepID=A0A0G3XJT0_9SPHN|nr:glutamate--tRNA ligase [Croceicoccus naphthovorans]AKM10871.1 glutamyl-tRNA ligase [Croceicoccus naphthovorans]MBB3989100.1 glutamyl-tRNA synthetase [Croceicoccus naphthovorans]
MTVTRFAPSPTGRLHVGNIRTALHNCLLARKAGGRFMLRIDDTDAARSEEQYVEAIRADLDWLGLTPDGEERQSERLALYDEAFEKLRAAGRVYRCYETAQELDLRRKVLLGRGLPPIYDRAALGLTEADHAAKAEAGVAPHWRFLIDREEAIAWDDGIRGPQKFEGDRLSDPVIRRADGSWLYMLPSAVDDIAMGVTDVLRGEDHVSNTAVQLQMFTALGATPPRFAHEALLTGNEGKLSKRLGSLGVDAFREQGLEAMAITSLLARIGTSQPVVAETSLEALADGFDLSTFGRAPARFDEGELLRLNAQIVHQMDYAEVRGLLPEGMDEAAWLAVRPNLEKASEAQEWWQVIAGDVPRPDLSDEERAFAGQAADVAETLDWGEDAWKALTAALKDATGRKGKALFLPLRLALTGMDHGPDMATLLPLIGKARAVERLRAAG